MTNCGIEAGHFGHALDDALRRVGIGAAFEEVGGVVAERVGDDILHGLRCELVLALKMRGGDGGQGDHPGNGREIAVLVDGGVEIGRDEDDAVHGDAELRLQVMRDARAAEAAVAFADEIFARTEAVVFDEPVVDDARQVLDVGLGAVEELLGLGFRDGGAAESGADGVDEDEVGEVEPGAGIVDQRGGIGGAVAFVSDAFKMLGADGAEVEIDRRSSGASIEGEGDGTVGAFDGVGGEDDADRLPCRPCRAWAACRR